MYDVASFRHMGNGDGGVNEDENDIMDVDEDEETDNIEPNEPSSDKGSKKKVSRLLNLRFIDSLAFMNCSLENLVRNLKASGMDNFRQLRTEFPNADSQELLTRKGIYPYDYMDGIERFGETQLPDRDQFYSQLMDEHISEDDYHHAQKVWAHWTMSTMGEYHDLYLRTDVLLLADIFESFRETCLKYYSLDPCHYFTAPGLSWDACLRKCGITLELVSDPDMHLMIEKGIRGGISTITHRHAKANNKYLKDFDPTKESSYVVYLDANNLYGWAMSQYLPTSEFRWLCTKKTTQKTAQITAQKTAQKTAQNALFNSFLCFFLVIFCMHVILLFCSKPDPTIIMPRHVVPQRTVW